MSLKVYTRKDYQDAVRLATDFFSWISNDNPTNYEEYGWLLTSLKNAARMKTEESFFVYRNSKGQIVGLIQGVLRNDSRTFEVDYFLIDPHGVELFREDSLRCQDVYDMLGILKAMVDSETGFDHVFLTVSEDNLDMLNILKDHGFTATNMLSKHFVDGEGQVCDGIVMQYWNQSLLPFDVTYAEKGTKDNKNKK